MRGMECTTEMPIQPNMSVVPTCLCVGSSRIALKFGFRLWPHIIFSPICRTHLDLGAGWVTAETHLDLGAQEEEDI